MPSDPSDRHKNDSDREFNELDYDTRRAFWYAWKWIAASVVAVLVIVVGLWVLGVFSSGVKGAGEAHKTNQSATNRIAKQEMFEQLYQDIQVADKRIDVMAAARAEDPSYPNKVNYTAAVETCNTLVSNYDAEARKYTSQDWRDNALPSAIDQTDKKFDCKESTP